MKFNTRIESQNCSSLISYQEPTCFIGSCFSDNIGGRLKDAKFDVSINPLGISYNPMSIWRQLELIEDPSLLPSDRVVSHEGRYFHLDFHSELYGDDAAQLTEKIVNALITAKSIIKGSKAVFITLGTAIVYTYQESVVSNCHKQDPTFFIKKMLSYKSLLEAIKGTVKLIKTIQPSAEVIFTISPVRHTREGLVANQQSKSLLRAVIGETGYDYFPSYEIMMDDLRDYRYYQPDMIHPSELAIDYIWDYFRDSYIDAPTKLTLARVEKIQQKLSHRAFNPRSEGHQRFLRQLKREIEELIEEIPSVDFNEELEKVVKEITV